MSTSSSTAPPSPLGECVVCGKESSTRCATCLQGGLNWMYFCSREHQKLIWGVHKRVCGGSFLWPALTPKERDAMIELSTKPMRGQNVTRYWMDSFKDVGITSSQAFGTITSNLLVERDRGRNQKLLNYFRLSRFSVELGCDMVPGGKFTYGDFQKFIACDPIGFLAYSQARWLNGVEDHANSSWYSTLQQRMLNLIGVLVVSQRSIVANDQSALRQYGEYLAHTMNQVIKIAREDIQASHREIAKTVIDVYLPAALKDAGAMIGEAVEKGNRWNSLQSEDILAGGDIEVVEDPNSEFGR